MKTCRNCGTQLEDSAAFCGNCGSRCEEPVYTTPQSVAKKSSSPVTIAIIAAFTVIVVSAMFIFAKQGINKENEEAAAVAEEEIVETIEVVGEETVEVVEEAIEVAEEDPVEVVEIPEKPVTVVVEPTPPPKKENTYMAYKSDAGWEAANSSANKAGGHLVYINNAEEFRKVCNLAYNNGIKVFWVGARRGYSQNWDDVRWNDGSYMSFKHWYYTEPSYRSEGIEECYLMVFYVDGVWYYNDAPESVSQYYSGRMGYIVEYEG